MGVEIKGLKRVLQQIHDFPVDLGKKVELVVEGNVRQMTRTAQRFAPKVTGELFRSIKAAKSGDLSWRVVVLAEHGPYMEFGTGGLVKVPEELVDIAIQYKGRGVKEINLKPQPYLYPAFELQRDIYVRELKELLQSETKKL